MPNLYLRKGGKNYYSPLVDVTSTRASDLIIRHGGQNYAVAKFTGTQVGNLDLYDLAGNTWTVYGSPTISTDWAGAFGGKSLYLNGSSYLKTDGKLLPQTFTIETRIKTGGNVSGDIQIVGQHERGISWDWVLFISDGSGFTFNGDDFGRISMKITPQANTEYHLAVCIDTSNVLRCFIDGVLTHQQTVSATRRNQHSITVGATENSSFYFTGYIDEVRISNVCRYTENFAPPTAYHTLDGNTLVLLRTK